MANNPRAFDLRMREARQRAYLATATLAELHPGVDEIGVELRFMLPSGQPHSSPHKRIFVPDMQAYFEVQCPERDCVDGGFDLGAAVGTAVSDKKHEATGTLSCSGTRGREPCGLTLEYLVAARMRNRA